MLTSTQLTLSYFLSIRKEINEPTFRLEDSLLICVRTTWRIYFVQKFVRYLRYNPNVATKSGGTGTESVTTPPPFGPIEGNKWFDQISSQWESQRNRFEFTSFGKIQFLPPCTEAVRHEREISNAGSKKLDFSERNVCKPVLLGLSLAENLVKPLTSLYGTEWRERGYGLWSANESCVCRVKNFQVVCFRYRF
jgi:hypothetical protein